MFYKITTYLPKDCAWELSPGDFVAQLGAAWPEPELSWQPVPLPDRLRGLSWELVHPPTAGDAMEATRLWGWGGDDEREMMLRGPLITCIDFLLWYRSLAPAEARLEFCDRVHGGVVAVEPTTDRRTILAALVPPLAPQAWAVLEALGAPPGWRTLAQLIAELDLSYTPDQRTIPELDDVLADLWEKTLICDSESSHKWAWDIMPISQRLGRLLDPDVIRRGITLSDIGQQALIARRAAGNL